MTDRSELHNKNLMDIEQFLKEYNIPFTKDVDRFILNDTPDKRSYDIHYIRSEDYPIQYDRFNIKGVQMDYFYKESIKAETNNSFKCWVKDYEWSDDRKREVLKSYFLHAVHLTPNRFFARDTELKIVHSKEARQFESENCFYGKRGASLNLGLYLKKDKCNLEKGTLLMIYTFGHNFFGKDNSIEVLRVGTKRKCCVVGGASKLLKGFLANYDTLKVGQKEVPLNIIKFYTDYDHNIGNSMEELGFEFRDYSKGGFMNYWIHENKIKGREPTRHKWVMSQMEQGNVFSVPNAGVKTHVMLAQSAKLLLNSKPKKYKISNLSKPNQQSAKLSNHYLKNFDKSFQNPLDEW